MAGAALALVLNLATNTVKVEADWWPPVVWSSVVVLICISAGMEVARRRSQAAPRLQHEIDAVAERFAVTVAERWRAEEEHRRVADPVTIPVRWRAAPDDLVDDWANIRDVPVGIAAAPLLLAGELKYVADLYRRIPSGRLAVLGRSGAGKTVLAARLLLDLMAGRSAGNRVPVIFSIGSWDPTITSLQKWMAGQLIRDYPDLNIRTADRTLAETLIAQNRILPIFDGFDEVGSGLRNHVLSGLNTAITPLILTSRPEEYAEAMGQDRVLSRTAVIHIEDLALNDILGYLPRTSVRRRANDSGQLWDPVLNRLRDDPSGMLFHTLSTPLALFLARAIYSESPGKDPSELLDNRKFPTLEAIEEHLLSQFIPAAYEQPSSLPKLWGSRQTQRWLAFLARHLHRKGTQDLAWWELRDSVPRPIRMIVSGCRGGLIGGVSAMLFSEAQFGFVLGITSGVMSAILYRRHEASGPKRMGRVSLQVTRRSLREMLPRLVLFGIFIGLIAILVASIVGIFAAWFFFGFGLIFVYFCMFLLLTIIFQSSEIPLDKTNAKNITDTLRVDRNNTFHSVVVTTVLLAVFSLLWTNPGGSLTYLIVVAVALGSATAWGQWLIYVRLWLPLTGRLPWRIPAFLADAYERGVLRQSGAVYQFRHARLQNYLIHADVRNSEW